MCIRDSLKTCQKKMLGKITICIHNAWPIWSCLSTSTSDINRSNFSRVHVVLAYHNYIATEWISCTFIVWSIWPRPGKKKNPTPAGIKNWIKRIYDRTIAFLYSFILCLSTFRHRVQKTFIEIVHFVLCYWYGQALAQEPLPRGVIKGTVLVESS